MREIIYIAVLVFLTQCRNTDFRDLVPPERTLTSFTYKMGGGELVTQYHFEYDGWGQVVKVFLNDSLYIELISRNAGLLSYQYYLPDEESSATVEVLVNENKNILEIVEPHSLSYLFNLPIEMFISPHFFFYLYKSFPGSFTDNISNNFVFFEDSLKLDFLFYQMPNFPSSFEVEEVFTHVTWKYSNKKSPVAMPMQDIAFLGGWINVNGIVMLQSLLHVLNINGYSSFVPERLIGEKIYSDANIDKIIFNYEFDAEGYVTRMFVRYGSTSPVSDTFEFTYSK